MQLHVGLGEVLGPPTIVTVIGGGGGIGGDDGSASGADDGAHGGKRARLAATVELAAPGGGGALDAGDSGWEKGNSGEGADPVIFFNFFPFLPPPSALSFR